MDDAGVGVIGYCPLGVRGQGVIVPQRPSLYRYGGRQQALRRTALCNTHCYHIRQACRTRLCNNKRLKNQSHIFATDVRAIKRVPLKQTALRFRNPVGLDRIG
jgi:hypothetical protein